jgi:hypothetical protein
MKFTLEETFKECSERMIKDYNEEITEDFYNEMVNYVKEYNKMLEEREKRYLTRLEQRKRQHKLKFSATNSKLFNNVQH